MTILLIDLVYLWTAVVIGCVVWGGYTVWRDRRVETQTRLTLVRRFREAESHESQVR